ncbi:hypothetical protein Rhopal_004357-T1 [Rhodotorula paludigena]|uniref:DUF1014-domain-containing protein n=1 Tax=Rhodotorula paludigena TaxID=86838 RepID=A0AAV5GFK0_9BASI|nr:hypothetical protein Rhopal_004357-T1 [Rhodotorula paludigena]
MAPKQNAKAAAAKARKEEAADGKKAKAAADAEAREADKWSQGAKGKGAKESKAEAAEAARAKKAERDRLLAEEEASQPSKPKAAPKAGAKKAPPKAPAIPSFDAGVSELPSSFSASGIDDALDMLTLVNAKTDKASVGSQAAKIETHPERRFKAAFEAYKEEQLPILRKEHPGLRLQQYHDRLYDNFKKSPLNPFNQAHIAHNSTKEDKVAALQAQKDDIARRLGEK